MRSSSSLSREALSLHITVLPKGCFENHKPGRVQMLLAGTLWCGAVGVGNQRSQHEPNLESAAVRQGKSSLQDCAMDCHGSGC